MKKQLFLLALPIALLSNYSYTEINLDNATCITVNATAIKSGEVDPQDWEKIFEIAQDLKEAIQNTEGVKGSVSICSSDNNQEETA